MSIVVPFQEIRARGRWVCMPDRGSTHMALMRPEGLLVLTYIGGGRSYMVRRSSERRALPGKDPGGPEAPTGNRGEDGPCTSAALLDLCS